MTLMEIKTSKELWRVVSCRLVVNTSPSNAGDGGSVPGQGTKILRTRTQAYLEKRLAADFYKVPRATAMRLLQRGVLACVDKKIF